MNNELQAIKCPQCGSTQHKKNENSHYYCLSCGTEYYIKNEHLKANEPIKKDFSQGNRLPPKMHTTEKSSNAPFYFAMAALFIGSLILYFLIGGPTYNKKMFSNASVSSPSQSIKTNKSVNIYETKKVITSKIIDGFDMPSPLNIEVIKESKGSNPNKDDTVKFFLVFSKVLGNKEIGRIPLAETLKTNISSLEGNTNKVSIHYFNKDHVYLVLFSRNVFKIDWQQFTLTEVTETLFSQFQRLDSGIASISPQRQNQSQYFSILANNGVQYYYYPIINKLYDKDEHYQQSHGRDNLTSEAKIKVGYLFTQPNLSPYGKNLPIQLVQYERLFDEGAPEVDFVSAYWKPKAGNKNIFTGKQNPKTILFYYDRDRVNSARDLMPERHFFSPIVLTLNNDMVIIQDKVNAASDSGYSIQAIDAKTGKMRWSIEVDKSMQALRFKDGFIFYPLFSHVKKGIVVDFNGKEITSVTLK